MDAARGRLRPNALGKGVAPGRVRSGAWGKGKGVARDR